MSERIVFGRNGPYYVIIDRDRGHQLELDRGAAKAVARFLMQELNVTEARLATGEDVFEKDEKLKTARATKEKRP